MSDRKRIFVTTFPLETTPRDRAILDKRFEAARSFYNATLGECLRRSKLMRESRDWRYAGKMPKGQLRTEFYRDLHKRFGFDAYSLHVFVKGQRKGFIGEHLDAHACQSLASRAFAVAERNIFKGGKFRFKRFREFRSIEGKANNSPLRWKNNHLIWLGVKLYSDYDRYDPVLLHGLNSPLKYARLIRMKIRGEDRYFAQLVCEGAPYKKQKHKPVKGVVGLDLGPSTIAIVSDQSNSLEKFCDELEDKSKEIRTFQRKADRRIRANNPECFDEKGRWKKGVRAKKRSRREKQSLNQVSELLRRQTAQRNNLHGQLVHRVLKQGSDVRMEKLSYKSFQINFGRSVGNRAPGMFVERLKQEASKWEGASVTEFSTYDTKLSQTCPQCGAIKKKKLSERQHRCPCGADVQRDLASAYLARFVSGDKLDAESAQKGWTRACVLLRAASGINNDSSVGSSDCNHVLPDVRRESSHANGCQKLVSAVDVVAGRKMQARATEKPVEDKSRFSLHAKRNCKQRKKVQQLPLPLVNATMKKNCGSHPVYGG